MYAVMTLEAMLIETIQIAAPGWGGLGIGRWVDFPSPQKKTLLLKPDTLFKVAVWQRSVEALRVTERG